MEAGAEESGRAGEQVEKVVFGRGAEGSFGEGGGAEVWELGGGEVYETEDHGGLWGFRGLGVRPVTSFPFLFYDTIGSNTILDIGYERKSPDGLVCV